MLKVERLLGREAKRKRLEAEIERLEIREDQRTDFQGMLFHELKNQLTIIGGFSRVMAENPCLAPEKYRHCAGVISECSSSLDALTEEVLLLLRLEAGDWPLPSTSISVEEILQQLIGTLSKQALEKRIAIHFDPMAKIPHICQNAAALSWPSATLLKMQLNTAASNRSFGCEQDFKTKRKLKSKCGMRAPESHKRIKHTFLRGFTGEKTLGKRQKGWDWALYFENPH